MELLLNLTQTTGAKSPAASRLQIQHDLSDGIVEYAAAFPIPVRRCRDLSKERS
ncbi:hypothetical protein TGAM01_v201860 [Trichoderma gamsii]|uniref:Uncharacterized protein n=1 Tax=Trichoderma gamsii TaxID=398673 RepID=A0A2P4ZZC2_9HYPO|nr:hypothetical protein TGAM01_v201860 [Trichoderma gamsii]PON29611.1 hypothetical protein TGAM01_v201860 [Trichoderma gamsii]